MTTTLKALVIAQTFNHRTKSTITTFQITMPRFVLAQLNKHRILSSNTESNRAVPIAKKDAKLLANPYFPLSWGTNQKGMQSGVPLQGFKHHLANLIWFLSLHSQRIYGNLLHRLGVHKEIVNRLTEPFQLVDIVITGTQWDNFFNLRTNITAQPEIREIALLMKKAVTEFPDFQITSDDVFLHLPYVHPEEKEKYKDDFLVLFAISSARCARVSYLNHTGNSNVTADVKLFLRLVKSGHWSALEHCAIASNQLALFGNFIGWIPVRKLFEGESGDLSMDNIPYLNPKQIKEVSSFPSLSYSSIFDSLSKQFHIL